MTAGEFRRMALALPGAVESAHMRHPDFRVEGKVFATLGYPDDGWGMVKLTPEQQGVFVKRGAGSFKACNGAWGERGATNVELASVKKAELKRALGAAVKNVIAAASAKEKAQKKRGEA